MKDLNELHDSSSFQLGAQFGIMRNTVFEISLNIKEHILTTHRELAELRRCSNMLRNKPNRKVYIIAPKQQKQSNFIKRTLIHLGVSCGQIIEQTSMSAPYPCNEIVLLVGNG